MEPDLSHSALVTPYRDSRTRNRLAKTPPGNEYFVCLGRGTSPIPWNPYDREHQVNLHTVYFGKAFVAMEEASESGGWTVYLTWDLDTLPSYGDRVVAIVLGDEWCRIPRYANRVGMLFKCYGIGPELGCRPFSQPSYRNWLMLFQHLNAWMRYAPGALRWRYNRRMLERTNRRIPPMYSIPLGYANQAELPLKPFFERKNDASFVGSVVHKPYKWWSPRRWFQTPKSYSRRRMIEALTRIADAHSSWTIDLKITPSYRAIRSEDPAEYARRVMDTRISLVPRGTSFETFRFFEALRFGCIVITEYLPGRWFYDGAPVVRVGDWRQLEKIMGELLANPDKMETLHRAALDWWKSVCSEEAVGRFMASRLNACDESFDGEQGGR